MTPDEYHIMNPSTNDYGHFYLFKMGFATIASWTPNGNNPNYDKNLMWHEQATAMWDDLMTAGYRLVKTEATSEVSS